MQVEVTARLVEAWPEVRWRVQWRVRVLEVSCRVPHSTAAAGIGVFMLYLARKLRDDLRYRSRTGGDV